MTDDVLELKIVRTGRVYPRVTVAQLRQWVAERRVLPDDLVRPVGARTWLRVAVAPELSPTGGPAPPGPGASPRREPRAVTPEADDGDLGIAVPAKTRPRRRWRIMEDTAMDMTPMIDVTFQLLIFFMLSNGLANSCPIEVPMARHGRGMLPDGKQAVLVDDQGGYYLGGSAAPENKASLDDLVREVRGHAADGDGPLEVIVSAHKASRHRAVRELVERLGTIERIGAIRLGVEEQTR